MQFVYHPAYENLGLGYLGTVNRRPLHYGG